MPVTLRCSVRSSVRRRRRRALDWRPDFAGAAESEVTGRAEEQIGQHRVGQGRAVQMSDYHDDLGGELRGMTVLTTSGRCQVEVLETVGGRSVRYLIDHATRDGGDSSAYAEYWNGERGEWVRLVDLPTFSEAGSGTCRCWVEEVDLCDDGDETPWTFGAQTAFAEMCARAHALLAPAARVVA